MARLHSRQRRLLLQSFVELQRGAEILISRQHGAEEPILDEPRRLVTPATLSDAGCNPK